MIEKMRMESVDMTAQNVEKIATLFPNCVTESLDEERSTPERKVYKKVVNFNVLRQMLSNDIIDGNESYEFTWVGKKKAIVEANKTIRKTLRPNKNESLNWDKTKNLYIQGDNLEVLKLLQESYLGKISMIYIDPPYNTGSNLIYKNNFFQNEADYLEDEGIFDNEGNRLVINSRTNGRFHSDWCTMIYSRLLLARNLLASDGVIALTIDDSEIENITSIMNEVFGEENHLATIVIKNNPSGRSTLTGISISHEYALFYSANTNVKLGRLPRNDKQIARYKERDEIGQFEWVNFRKHGGYKEDAPSMYYPIYINKENMSFRIPKLDWDNDTKEYIALEQPTEGESVSFPIDENGRCRRWKWSIERARSDTSDMCVRLDRDKKPAVYIKSRMKDEGMLPLTVWDDKQYSSTEYGTNLLKALLGKRYFDYPKSIYAVMDCLRIGHTGKDGIFLDFFSGSATTAEAIMRLNAEDGGNRQFIMVQLPEKTEERSEAYRDGFINICEIGKERIRRAGAKIREDAPLMTDELDVGFRVFKLDDSNMNDVYYSAGEYTQDLLSSMESNVKSDRTDLDLLFGCLLEWGLPLSMQYTSEEIDGFTVHTYNNGDLIACFDENVTNSVIKTIAKRQPLRAVFRDNGFKDSPSKINVGEIFKMLAPDTRVKVI